MSAGALICLGLIAVQLGAQIGVVLQACWRHPRALSFPPVSSHARRSFLDRKAEVERDARHRF